MQTLANDPARTYYGGKGAFFVVTREDTYNYHVFAYGADGVTLDCGDNAPLRYLTPEAASRSGRRQIEAAHLGPEVG